METTTLTNAGPPADPDQARPGGFGPTPDPTRSGALWVGGAGVALLLAAAAVLTAVRWDDIGQSVKLGGLVAITLALLAAGRRFASTIPMTAQAIFHLGALLIPFDMAAVAILAGRSWHETLLLTSVTSVAAWYGIDQSYPSAVLRWSARLGVVATAAGIAAVSTIAMPLALSAAAVAALAIRKPVAASVWAAIAAAVPLAAFVPWPPRISGAMFDLGFDQLDQWQPLIAGSIATLVLIGVTRLITRVEVAWAAVVAASLTAIVALGGFADSQISYVSIAALFLIVELLAFATATDRLWKPITELLAVVGELVSFCSTIVLLAVAIDPRGFNFDPSSASIALSAVLLSLAWLTADVRRLKRGEDWLAAVLFGSDWSPTTVMFPLAVVTAVLALDAPASVVSVVLLTLAYWMVGTWRTGGTVGAVILVLCAAIFARATSMWAELALGAGGALILMLAANLRERGRDSVRALGATFGGVLVWLVASEGVVDRYTTHWPLAVVIAGLWVMSWVVEARRTNGGSRPADWIGRLTAIVVLASSMWINPIVALGLCLIVAALAGADYWHTYQSITEGRTTRLRVFSAVAGAALGLAAVPVTALAGLVTTTAGGALALAGFVIVGLALVSPRAFEVPMAAAALVTSLVGLGMAVHDDTMFAFALIAIGCSTMFIATAQRLLPAGVVGYALAGVGVALELAAFDVTALEAYLLMPAFGALAVGWRHHRSGGSSWAAFVPTIALYSYVAIAERLSGGSAWHAVIAGAVGVFAIIGGGYRRLVGPLVSGSIVLAIVVGYESLGPAALVPTWAWLAAGGSILLGAGVAMERSDTTPLERGQQIRTVIATQFS